MLVWSISTWAVHYLRTSLEVIIWIDEKDELILLKLSSIWMTVHAIWIEIQVNWIQIYFSCNQIKFLK
jgi:hypothetical protein